MRQSPLRKFTSIGNQVVARAEYAPERTISVVFGDLTLETADALVNPSTSHLAHHWGAGRALVQKGGDVIQAESNAIVNLRGPLSNGDAVVTSAGRLQAKYIIHAVGPRYRGGSYGEAEALTKAVHTVLSRCEQFNVSTVSMPAISSGMMGYPKEQCATILFQTVLKYWHDNPLAKPHHVRFVNFDCLTVQWLVSTFRKHFASGSEKAKQIISEVFAGHVTTRYETENEIPTDCNPIPDACNDTTGVPVMAVLTSEPLKVGKRFGNGRPFDSGSSTLVAAPRSVCVPSSTPVSMAVPARPLAVDSEPAHETQSAAVEFAMVTVVSSLEESNQTSDQSKLKNKNKDTNVVKDDEEGAPETPLSAGDAELLEEFEMVQVSCSETSAVGQKADFIDIDKEDGDRENDVEQTEEEREWIFIE